MKIEPWVHTCKLCGAEYTNASKRSYACPECMRKKDNEDRKKRREKPGARERENKLQSQRYYANLEENREKYREYMKKRREKRKAAKIQDAAVPELVTITPAAVVEMHYCRRLHLKATTLPCGRYEGACTKNCPDRMKVA